MTRLLIPKFPREIAFPRRRICLTEEAFYSEVNKHNKIKSIFYSVFHCDDKRNFSHTIIDKIPFDFDSENPSNLIPEILKFNEYLMQKNFKHIIFFSGKKGFHIYVFTKNGDQLNYIKDTLYNAQEFLISEANNFMEKKHVLHPDLSIFGDIKRILRMPNTWHLTGKRYCIPISRTDLEKGIEHIYEMAKMQNFEFTVYGNKPMNLADFDRPCPKYQHVKIPEIANKLQITDETIKHFLPCIQCILTNTKHPETGEEMGNWQGRYLFAIYAREIGLEKEVASKIAKQYFGKVKRTDNLANNYQHFVNVHALDYAYGRNDFFWNCALIWQRGFCLGRCKKWKGNNASPLYK